MRKAMIYESSQSLYFCKNCGANGNIDLQIKNVQGRPSEAPILRAKKPRPPLHFFAEARYSVHRGCVIFERIHESMLRRNLAKAGTWPNDKSAKCDRLHTRKRAAKCTPQGVREIFQVPGQGIHGHRQIRWLS